MNGSYARLAGSIIVLTAMLSASQRASAQAISTYAFSDATVSTYTAISGGTVLGGTGNTSHRFLDPATPAGSTSATSGPGFPLGFTFTYNGAAYDRIGISTDGWVCLGQSALTPSVNMPASIAPLSYATAITPAQLRARVAGMGRDLAANGTSDLRIETIGTTPNQVCVVQWTGYQRSGTTGTGDILNYQIRLYETTNVVEVHFGSCAFGTSLSSNTHSGLGGFSASEFNSRTTTTDWNATTAAAAAGTGCTIDDAVAIPTNGRVFRWTPPACLAPSATPSVSIDCVLGQFTVNVDLTALGSGNTSVDLVHTIGGTPTTQYDDVTTLQSYAMGPFPLGTTVQITVVTNPDAICTLNLGSFLRTVFDCPIATFPFCQDFDDWTDGGASSSCTFVMPLNEGWSNTTVPGWLVETSGTANSTGTGPDQDHTTGAAPSKYLYIEASGNCTERIAQSNTFDITTLDAGFGAEVSLWRHMWGAQIGTFTLEVEDVSTAPGVYTTLYTQTGNQGNQWLFTGWLDVDAVVTGPLVRFRVRATQNGTFEGDIAIDDFCVRETLPCVPPTATATGTSNCTPAGHSVSVDLTGLGDALTVDIVEIVNAGAPTVVHDNVSALQTYAMGPYATTDVVQILVKHDVFSVCDVDLGLFSYNPALTCLDCASGTPINTTYCYVASDNQSWLYGTNGPGILRLTFNRGTVETNNFDDLIIYDGADASAPILFANPANTGNLGPAGSAILNTDPDFFAVDVFSTGPNLFMTFTSDPSVSCSSSTTYDPWDWDVSCIDCLSPVATPTVVPACATSQFNVDVNVTSLGNGASVDISVAVNGGAPTVVHTAVGTGVHSVGPFNSGDQVDISVLHDTNSNCDLDLATVTYTCPINTYPACQDFDAWTPCSTVSTCTITCALEDGWSNVGTTHWRTDFGTVPSAGTGPNGDHTTGLGNFLYIETSSLCSDRIAESPLYDIGAINAGNGGEASVWYNMWDNLTGDMGTFSVAVEDVTNSPGTYTTLFTISGNQGPQWNFSGWLDLSTVVGPIVRFRVTGTNAATFNGDMAFDDFCVREQLPCVPPTATATGTSNCAPSGHSVSVDLTGLGDALTVDIVEIVNAGAPTVVHDNVSALQVYAMGPYATTDVVQILVKHDVFSVCDVDLGLFTYDASLTCLDCASGTPINTTYCYVANDDQSWLYGTNGPGILRLTFNRGTVETNSFDDLIIYDGPDASSPILFANPANTGNLGPAGSAINSTDPDFFAVDVFSTGPNLFMTFTSDGSVYCSGNATYDAWDWDVVCVDCVSPTATASQVIDCALNNFTVQVDLTALGSSATVDIVTVVNAGTPTVVHDNVSALQVYNLGPYALTDVVDVTVVHATNNNCDLAFGPFSGAGLTCVACGGAPLTPTYCYVGSDNQTWHYYKTGTGQLRLRFLRGTVETNSFDDLIIYDGPDATYPVLFANPANTGNLGPAGSAILNTDPDFFAVDVTATGDHLFMAFTSDPSVQCATATNYDPWEWEVFCFDCTPPTAATTVVPDCANNQFSINVDLTFLGDATDVDILTSVNGGTPVLQHDDVSTLQIYSVGPFASGSNVVVKLNHNQDALCNISLPNVTHLCAPTLACGTYSASPNVAVPDNGFVTSTIVTGPLSGELITDLDVVVKVNHTDNADLDIQLTSPSGTVVDLTNDQCSSGDGIEIRFSDEALTTIQCASPTTNVTMGTFKTSGTLADPLSNFDYQLFEGTWTLRVTDDLTTDMGTLVQWCLIPTLVVPDCATPSALAVTGTTVNSATLNWTSGSGNTGYEIEYGPPGFTPGTGTVVTGSLPPPVTITGLTSATTYQFYLTETCPAGESVQIGPVSSTTAVLIAGFPYCQDMEAYPLSGTTCATVNTLTPSLGWVNENEGATGTDWLTDENGTPSVTTGPSVDHTLGTSAGNYLYVEASTCANRVARLRSPEFDVSGMTNQPIVSFWYHMCGNDGAMGTLSLEMEEPAGSNNWTLLYSRSGEDPDQTTEAAPWKQVSVTLTNLGSSNIAFRITGTTLGTGFEGDMAIDDFCVTEAPCFLPEATLGQAACNNNVSWNLEVNVTDIGTHTGVDISVDLGGSQSNVGLGTYTFGPYGNNQEANVTITSVNDPLCTVAYSFTGDCSPQPTDDCSQAPALLCGDAVSGTTTGFTNTLPPTACPFSGSPSLGGVNWWSFTTPVDQDVIVSTCGTTTFDSRLSIFEAMPDCNNLVCVSLNDNVTGCSNGSSELSFLASGGVTYYIAVHGQGGANGSYTLSIICGPPCLPATTNDVCAQAEPIVPVLADGLGLPTMGDNTCAYTDGSPNCNLLGNIQGVWYTFNSGSNTNLSLTLIDNAMDPAYSATALSYVLYNGTCNVLTATGEIDCDVTGSGTNALPGITAGTDYLLLVYNAGGIGTEGTFGVLLEYPPQNDAAITAVDYPDGLVCTTDIIPSVTLQNLGQATLTEVTITYSIDGGTPVVFNWTGSLPYVATELVELSLSSVSPGPHSIAVYSSGPNAVPDEVPANDDATANFDATGEEAIIVIRTDTYGSETTWQIFDAFSFPVASGGPYTGQNNQVVNTTVCLPTSFGTCFNLQIYDSFGDGICCTYGPGFWEVRDGNNELLLRDIFIGSGTSTFGEPAGGGSQTPDVPPQNPGYPYGHEFCLAKGPADLDEGECGVYDNTLQAKVYATAVAGATNYQFEFTRPDEGFMRRIAVPRRWVKFSEMVTVPAPSGVPLFCRARVDQGASGFLDDHFGAGCELGLAANAYDLCTQLIDDISLPTHSCGVTRSFGGGDKLWAYPVVTATQYRFQFENTGEGYLRNIIRPTYVCLLSWATAPLNNGSTYAVRVQVFVAGAWRAFCGADCNVTILNPPMAGGSLNAAPVATTDGLQLWPNPVRDGNVNLLIEGIEAAEQHVTVEVFDAFGRRVHARDQANSGEVFNTILELGTDIAPGIYEVRVRVNDSVYLERLTIQ